MKIYWTTIGEMAKSSPEIFTFNLKSEGMFIGAPGTVIFRTKEEALTAIDKAKAELQKIHKEV